ncbi:zinc finger protein isoform X2 [Anabrus simplex]|uniref:zinc finger protein isoform X2 n=1 Tax=Anabrus simplex TaxID=316456 RepID=UPI0035A270E0
MLKSMEEPVFVKCEPAWHADAEETCNFEENAVRLSDNQVKVKEDPHAVIADLNLEEPAVNIKDEIIIEENNLQDFVRLTEGPLYSSDDSSQIFNQETDVKCQSKTPSTEVSYPPSLCSNILSLNRAVTAEVLPPTRAMRYVCKICNESFSERERIHEHLSTHFKPHKCEVCSKAFAVKGNMKRHMLTHSTQKLFCCSICNKKFKVKRALTSHSLIHTGVKPHQCSVCKKGFVLKCRLEAHLAVHFELCPFECKVCNRAFQFKSLLARHLLTHSGEEKL